MKVCRLLLAALGAAANCYQVYLPAISDYVPAEMVHALSAFLEFCYLVRRSTIDEDCLLLIDDAVARYHAARDVFIETGVRDDFSLPRQHAMIHYRSLIQAFGAPNSLCSSITESKHIKAVKEPWRRSNRNQPLGQMLLVNQRLDKLAAARVFFQAHGMLSINQSTPVFLPCPPSKTAPSASVLDNDDANDVIGMTTAGEINLARKSGAFAS